MSFCMLNMLCHTSDTLGYQLNCSSLWTISNVLTNQPLSCRLLLLLFRNMGLFLNVVIHRNALDSTGWLNVLKISLKVLGNIALCLIEYFNTIEGKLEASKDAIILNRVRAVRAKKHGGAAKGHSQAKPESEIFSPDPDHWSLVEQMEQYCMHVHV